MNKMLRPGLVVVLMCAAVLAVPAQNGPADVPRIDVEKYTLPNGLEVILAENHKLPRVAVNLWYHVGPAHEAAGRTGFAHLFEHMMFQGSKHVRGDSHFRLLEGAGATGLNGTTSFDRTNYYETVPANQLELALWLESDRMGYLLDRVDQTNLSNQQDVVRNERRQRTENAPYGVVGEALFQALFPPGHPYRAVIIGSHADIQAAKLEDVRQFFTTYYAPNNASLVIAGDIDKAAARRLVEKYFGTLKGGPPVPPAQVDAPVVSAERRVVVTDRVELPRVYMGWHAPAIFKDGDAELDLAGQILGDGTSSRLHRKLVYEMQIAQNVQASVYSLMLGSVFRVVVTARPGHSAGAIEAAIDEELERFRNDGPTAVEIERARNVMETGLMSSLQSLGGLADRLNHYNHYLGTPDYLARDIERYRRVTPESIRRAVQQYLRNDRRVVVHGLPGTQELGPEVPRVAAQGEAGGNAAAGSSNPDEPWRAVQPSPSAARAASLPVPQSFQLANGLTVLHLPQPALPLVSASLVVRTGSDANPLDKPGLASFSIALLDQGTETRSALQLSDDIAQIGASLTTDSAIDSSSVGVSSLARNFPAALSLLSDVALRPSFPAAEVERTRAARLAGLVQQRSNPDEVARNVMASVLYGPSHPYGFAVTGTADSIASIGRDELQRFWRQHFVPGNAALIVSGAIGLPELHALAEANFGGWARGSVSPSTLGEPPSTRPRLVIVDRSGSPQTMVRVATVGAPRSSPDYMPLRVMNAIFGGLFSSRVNMNLREAHGYTYGARSQVVFSRSAGPLAVATGVRTDVTAPAVQEIFNEVKKMIETTVTADELAMAKDAITQSLPATFETNGRTVASLEALFTYRLPLNYYSTQSELISVVDARSVQEMARKYLVPERLVVIAVGDRSRIGAALETSFGPADLRDLDGRPVSR